MSSTYLHVACGQRVKNSAYHCGACHRSFIGLTAFDGHRAGMNCDMLFAADPYQSKPVEFWEDDEGYWHRGQKMTDEQKQQIWGTNPAPPATPMPVIVEDSEEDEDFVDSLLRRT